MRRVGLILFVLLSVFGAPSAQTSKPDGYLEVTFGHVRGPGGSTINPTGLRLPYHIQRIDASRIVPGVSLKGTNHSIPPILNTVYNCDAGGNYGFIDPNPSSLDDIVTTGAGIGTPWNQLTFGINVTDNHQFLVRWIVYGNYVQGRGAGVSAFDNVIADFGGFLNGQAPGTYKLTVDVSPAGVVCDRAAIFVAQQFRSPQGDGNGPFDTAIGTVFNPSAPPQVGTSDDVFWYDADTNGIYDDQEQDTLGSGNLANFLFGIAVGGSQDTLVPFAYTIDQGTYSSGDITSLWFADQNYLVIRGRTSPGLNSLTPHAEAIVEGIASSNAATSLTVSVTSALYSGTSPQKIELFNYTTQAWDLVDTRPLSTVDSTANVTITSNPAKYINQANRHLKARISCHHGITLNSQWLMRIDKTNWIVSHP